MHDRMVNAMVRCRVLAEVVSTKMFASGKVKRGDWVVLERRNDWEHEPPSYRTKHKGTWGKLGPDYRPMVNLETGERYE